MRYLISYCTTLMQKFKIFHEKYDNINDKWLKNLNVNSKVINMIEENLSDYK